MMNIMEFNGYHAAISYDPEIEMFRGEFINLNGGADFYAADIKNLKKEGEISLKIFLQACAKKNINPKKDFSGKFNVRIPPDLHEEITIIASATGKSLNQLVIDTLSSTPKLYP
ncbi:MAG: type II toxin-antitoxin system HicB family antitoxin [Rickettsiales bacterium]